MKKVIAIAKGDGIGPEVVDQGMKILQTIAQFTDFEFDLVETPLGGTVWKKTGTNLPETSFSEIKRSDAILFGAIGLPDLPQGVAESAILKLRQGLDLYVNLRPIKLYKPLYAICPLKTEYINTGIDFTVIRENTESVYARIGKIVNGETAINSMVYTKKAVSRIIEYAFEYAKRKGYKEVISVDKANLLACSLFWRQIFDEMGKKYPEMIKKNFYVDAFCQWIIRSPSTIQTVVTENMFGDIISDEAAYLIGSLGMAASGNIHPGKTSMYEPIHGSAPDIAGKGIANPIGTILSVKLMIEESFHQPEMGNLIESAIEETLWTYRTPDIYPLSTEMQKDLQKVSCNEMGNAINVCLRNKLKQ